MVKIMVMFYNNPKGLQCTIYFSTNTMFLLTLITTSKKEFFINLISFYQLWKLLADAFLTSLIVHSTEAKKKKKRLLKEKPVNLIKI